MSGFKYYILFVNDFGHYSWIYPLHMKYASAACFSYLSLELTKEDFKSFLDDCGIVSRISCLPTLE